MRQIPSESTSGVEVVKIEAAIDVMVLSPSHNLAADFSALTKKEQTESRDSHSNKVCFYNITLDRKVCFQHEHIVHLIREHTKKNSRDTNLLQEILVAANSRIHVGKQQDSSRKPTMTLHLGEDKKKPWDACRHGHM
jgi:hypothetical protein